VHSLLKYLPGGPKLAALAESAPYLLVVALIAHHAMFGTDLLVIGGYTVATWITERLSNEVASRTRATNVRIAERFTRLAHDQIQSICTWLDHQAIASKALGQIDDAASDLAKAADLTEGQR
jgi:Ran GTPase-activating protein (RanGAP) involved in mRNA processing and transport